MQSKDAFNLKFSRLNPRTIQVNQLNQFNLINNAFGQKPMNGPLRGSGINGVSRLMKVD